MLIFFFACSAILLPSNATDLINSLQRKEFFDIDLQEGSANLQKLTELIADTKANSKIEARKYECTALGYAASERFTGLNSKLICERLVASGADVHAIQFGGDPLIFLASTADTVQFLLDKGENVDARNKSRRTPLFQAASNGNPELVKILIQNGANPYLKDNAGRTAFDAFFDKFKSQMIGVHYDKEQRKWHVARWSKAENKMIYGGLYMSAKTAAYASDDLEAKLRLNIHNTIAKLRLNYPDSDKFDRRYRCLLILESCLNDSWVILNTNPSEFLKQPINYSLVRRKISEFLGTSFIHKK